MVIVTSMLIHLSCLQSLYQNLDTIRRTFAVATNDLALVEIIVERNIFIYNFDIQEGEYVGELARRSIGKFEKTVKLLRFNNHIIHTNDIDSFFKCFRCPSCDCFFNRSDNFNRHLLTCKDRVRHIFPKNA